MSAPLAPAAFEAAGMDVERGQAQAQKIMEKLGKGAELSPDEVFGLEAIILPAKRPVVFIQDDRYLPIPLPEWEHLNSPAMHDRLEATLPSIGRVEVPLLQDVPYGGTGFVVGPNLLMTNRHVAALFTRGLGV